MPNGLSKSDLIHYNLPAIIDQAVSYFSLSKHCSIFQVIWKFPFLRFTIDFILSRRMSDR